MKKLRKSQVVGIREHWHWWGDKPVCSEFLGRFNVCLREAKDKYIVLWSGDSNNQAFHQKYLAQPIGGNQVIQVRFWA